MRKLGVVTIFLLTMARITLWADDTQQTLLNEVTATAPVIDSVLSKWKAIKADDPEMQKANSGVVNELEAIRKATAAIQQYQSIPVVPPAVLSILWSNWRALKTQMLGFGIQPIETAQGTPAAKPEGVVATPAPRPAAGGVQAEAVGQAVAPRPQTTASRPAITTTPNPSRQPAAAAATAETAPAPAVGQGAGGGGAVGSTVGNAQEPKFGPSISPSSIKLVVDIAREWDSNNFQKGCSNRPSDQTADNWTIRISAVPLWPDSTKPSDRFFLGGNLFISVLTQGSRAAAPAIAAGARTYVGSLQAYARKIDLNFSHLTLADATDLVKRLADSPQTLQQAFRDGDVSLRVYQVSAVPINSAEQLTGNDIQVSLTCKLEPSQVRKFLVDNISSKADASLTLEACDTGFNTLPALTAKLREVTVGPQLMQSMALDATSIQKTLAAIKMLADSQLVSFTSDEQLAKDSVSTNDDPKSAESAGTQTVTDSRQQLLLIDNPCLTVSVAPLLNGNEITPVLNFRYDYNYFTAGNALIARIHAEGETASNDKYFQRLLGYGNLTTLIVSPGGWQFYGGAVGTYSGTRNSNGVGSTEWTVGGQFQLQAPVLTVLSGANSRPTFIFSFGGAGGDATSTRTTDFVTQGGFVYTYRPTTQLSLDLTASGAWSNHPRYMGHQQSGYLSFVGRYNVKGDWDFIGKYECGRVGPDYRKFCGWQTGVNFLTGR